MNDPYRDRQPDQYKRMAKAFEDLADATKNLEMTANAAMWSLVIIVLGIAGVIGLNIWLMP